jgi:hypothetical protein
VWIEAEYDHEQLKTWLEARGFGNTFRGISAPPKRKVATGDARHQR